jgi:hypothetical protein
VKIGDRYLYAARCAHELTCFPDSAEARERVELAWLAIGADYFGTLRAVIAKADAQAVSTTSVYDAMTRVADAATRVAEQIAEASMQ